jgi:hypothetical protein
MNNIRFDEVILIDWYRSDTAATDLEANDWYWNGELEATGTVCLFKLLDELVAWSSRRGDRMQIHRQADHSIQENIRDIRSNFSGNIDHSTQIMCMGNPEWEDELELGDNHIFEANDGDGYGSEISLKEQIYTIKKNPHRLICIHRNVYKGGEINCTEKEITDDIFWDQFEPIDSLERSAFILEK